MAHVKKTLWLGFGCGTVGKAVVSYARDLQFESRSWQKFPCKVDRPVIKKISNEGIRGRGWSIC